MEKIQNKTSFEILIRYADGEYFCELPSSENGSPIPVAVTRDFFNWFPQTRGIVLVDEAFQLARDQGGDIIPVFLYQVPKKS